MISIFYSVPQLLLMPDPWYTAISNQNYFLVNRAALQLYVGVFAAGGRLIWIHSAGLQLLG